MVPRETHDPRARRQEDSEVAVNLKPQQKQAGESKGRKALALPATPEKAESARF
jgi:hypothetical protein